MTTRRTRTTLLALGVAAVWATGACSSGSGTAGPTTSPSEGSASSSPATSAAAGPSTGPAASTSSSAPTSPAPTGPAASSPPVDAGIPAGAGTATTVDLDGDGRPDTLWLADVDGRRTLGVTTTAHGTSSLEFTSAAPQSASASAAVLASGAPVVLLDTGRSVQVYGYRVEDPGLVVVPDTQGVQYSFSLGFTDYGTGLTCEEQSDGLHLFGENATSGDGSRFTVTRTEVTVDVNRPHASNGATTTVGEDLAADDPVVQAARGTTCGPDAAVAAEPV